jgi:hypothetical protein
VEGTLDDTASSPGKRADMEVEGNEKTNSGVKRQLLLENKSEEDVYASMGAREKDNETTMATGPNGHAEDNVVDTSVEEIKKRTKKAGADSPSFGSVCSFDDPVRS